MKKMKENFAKQNITFSDRVILEMLNDSEVKFESALFPVNVVSKPIMFKISESHTVL